MKKILQTSRRSAPPCPPKFCEAKLKRACNSSGIKKQKSFTLIETLVYVIVLGIIIGVISSLLLWQIYTNAKAKVARETFDSARIAMDRMTREIKEAISIYEPTTNPFQLSLEKVYEGVNGEATTYVDFYLCDTQLCIKEEWQDSKVLTSNAVEVTNLVFTKVMTDSIPSVQIDLTLNYKNPSGKPEYNASINLTSTTSLRPFSYTK